MTIHSHQPLLIIVYCSYIIQDALSKWVFYWAVTTVCYFHLPHFDFLVEEAGRGIYQPMQASSCRVFTYIVCMVSLCSHGGDFRRNGLHIQVFYSFSTLVEKMVPEIYLRRFLNL
jgi:hypothetical protein